MTNSKKFQDSYVFFIGGNDAEMFTIKSLLEEHGMEMVEKNLVWGARPASYEAEIAAAVEAGKTPVLLELDNKPGTDWGGNPLPVIDLPKTVIDIDHHGDRSKEPATILQVCSLLGVEPTRHQRLIAANDAGYIGAMLAAGATQEEVEQIRLLERKCQGVTAEHELLAKRAISAAEDHGQLKVVYMEHSKCAPVTDYFYGKQPKQNLLIISVYNGNDQDGNIVLKKELNYYGEGAYCGELEKEFGGWSNSEAGFYGTNMLSGAMAKILAERA